MKGLVLILCVVLSYSLLVSGNAKKDVETTVKAMEKAVTAVEKLNDFLIKTNPAQMFAQVSKVLTYLGPALMVASAVMSIVAIFLPQEDSAELKAINAGFDKVNRKLDIITTEIRDLKNIVELSSAKSAYIKYVTAINSNYENLEDAKVEQEKASYDYFVKQFELTFNLATENLYDALTGKLGSFGFNLVNLYKDYVKCNPVLISKFCTMGMQTLSKGLIVEGAYLGALNLTEKAEEKKAAWEIKMQTVADYCIAVIGKCEENWKETSAQHLREVYNEQRSDNNQEFAKIIAKSLNEVVPQRSWFVISYNDASGFEEHSYNGYYERDEIWNQHNKDVTVFSTPQEETSRSTFLSIKAKVDTQLSKVANPPNCAQLDWMPQDAQKFGGKDLRTINSFVREALIYGVIYAVKSDKNPGFAITGNTIYSTEFVWKCTSYNYQLIAFV